MPKNYGGSFAPPLTPEKIAAYRGLAETAPTAVRDAVRQLCDMAELFQQTPPSSRPGTPHPSGRGVKVPLEQSEIDRIWDAVPWDDEVPGDHVNECAVLARLFDGISNEDNEPLRNAAFHLLWYAKELARDREPITTDRL